MPAPIVLSTLDPETKRVPNPPPGEPVIATDVRFRDGSRATSGGGGGSTPVGQVALSSLPLVPSQDITSGRFIGAFKLPVNSINYTRGAVGVSPDDTKFYAAGHAYDFNIKQFSIPVLVNETTATANLNEAPLLQDSGNLYGRIPVTDWPDPTGGGASHITGIYDTGSGLIVNGMEYYDAAANSLSTAFMITDRSDLPASTIKGTYRVGDLSYANGWITKVPDNLTDSLGADLIFGFGTGAPILSRLSNGPSCFPVNLSDIESASDDSVIPTTPIINYPLDNALRSDLLNYGGAIGGVNNTVHVERSSPKTGIMVPGTRTYAVFGHSGGHNPGPLSFTQQTIDGSVPISPGTPCSTPYTGHGGGPNGTIFYKNDSASWTTKQGTANPGYAVWDEEDRGSYLWLYDLDEARSLTNPYDAEPYFAGYAGVAFNGSKKVRGACFNAQSGRLYVFTDFENGVNPDVGQPVIMVFDLSEVI